MKRKVFKLLPIFACFLNFGCAGIKIIEDRKQFQETQVLEDYSYNLYIPYFRYVSTPVDITHYCKGKEWKGLYVSGTILGGFVSVLSLGIIHPQKIEATCSN